MFKTIMGSGVPDYLYPHFPLSRVNFKGIYSDEMQLSPFVTIILFCIFIALIILATAFVLKNRALKRSLKNAEYQNMPSQFEKEQGEESIDHIKAHAVIGDVLSNVSGKERSIPQFLNDALNKLLFVPWLNVVNRGSVFLINEEGMLDMVAEKNMGELKTRCSLVKPGECFCGKAYSENAIQYTSKTPHNHKPVYEGMEEHGHFTVPIRSGEHIEGVLNLYVDANHSITAFEEEFLTSVADTLGSVINRKKAQNEIAQNNLILAKQKQELELSNLQINEYLSRLEKQAREMETLNEIQKIQKKDQENLNQQLFAQKLEVEQRNFEIEHYSKKMEEQTRDREQLNQKLFAQKLEVEQRNFEIEQYSHKLEEQTKEQEKLNQKLFAQKLEVEQRNFEVELYSKQLEEQAKEQEKLNQILFAQKLEVEQRNSEVQQYAESIEKQKKEQDRLNQKLFAQSLEVDQRSFEIELYAKEINKLKLDAESAYKNISDSINYSKTIQDSLLPTLDLFHRFFPDRHFVLYKPKDVIGGDFYFVNQVNDYLIFAVADCTGHGVPGALITMLGLTYLQDITERNAAQDTGRVLEILRARFKESFKAYGKDVQNKNGMDIAVCALNLKTGTMQYSGALLPLIIIREGEIIEHTSVRNPIGFYPVEKNFETVQIELKENDNIYLFSDGFQDQTGGAEQKKFLKRKFYEMLKEISKYPMPKQKEFIDKILQKWMGRTHQIDDITIMGIRWQNPA
jgi:serine phosphatase RsbU (regulator of sigma subunit)/putative methionine-R-sulfoxide reductase with GAF domain